MPHKDPEVRREYARRWSAANRVCLNERSRRWREANRERKAEVGRQWYEANRERIAEAYRSPEGRVQGRKNENRRRARKLGAAHVEHVDRRVVLESHDEICGICGDAVDPLDYHVDHIVPLTRGGDHTYDNSQPAHPSCNLRKHNKLPEE